MRKSMQIHSVAVLAALAGSATCALAQAEVEPNDSKATANTVLLPAASTAGVLTGNSISATTTGLDYFRVQTPAAPLGIYRHELIITTTGAAGHTGSIRGIGQTAAAAGVWDGVTVGTTSATTDAQFQTSSTGTTPARTNAWYGFGKQEEIYYRVTGTATTTGDYSINYAITPVSAIAGPSAVAPGIVVIETIGQTTVDTDMWLYDSNFNAIFGAGNDDESINGGGTGGTLQSRLQRNLTAGTYYLAISRFGLANNQFSPNDDDFRTGSIIDFPDAVVCSSSTTTAADLDVVIGGTPVTVLGATGTGYDVQFVQFTVTNGPTNPFGTGSAQATDNCGGSTSLITVNVTPGTNPASTGLAVTADTSGIGGSGTQQLFDDGTNGDVTGGDNIFSYLATISNTQPAGVVAIPFSITDAESRTAGGSLNMSVVDCPLPGDNCSSAFSISGLGTFAFDNTGMTRSPEPGSGSGPDLWFRWTAPSTGNYDMATCGLATFDTVMSVYTACGAAANIANNDDSCGLQSELTFAATGGVEYFFRIGGFGATNVGPASFSIASAAPTATGSASPTSVFIGTALPGFGSTSTLSVTVTPGAGTITGVTADLSALGLSTVTLTDPENDNIWTATVDFATATGPGAITYTVSDSIGNNVPGNIALSVNRGVVDLGSLQAAASGLLVDDADIAATEVRWFKLTLDCEMNAADLEFFDLDTDGSTGASLDTELGLYDASGNLVATDDDGGTGAASLLTFGTGSGNLYDALPANGADGAVLAAGDYYLALGEFNTNFNATGFDVNSTGTATTADINLNTNLSCVTLPTCNSIDFNQDGLFPDDSDLIDFLSVFAGGGCSNDPFCDGIDFNNDGLFPDDQDLIDFLTVAAGGTPATCTP